MKAIRPVITIPALPKRLWPVSYTHLDVYKRQQERVPGATGEIVNVKPEISKDDIRIEIKDIVKSMKEMVSLTDAKIICSGGRGLGDASGFELIQKFADKVGGVVGSSRAAVDAGWIDHSHQVGPVSYTHLDVYKRQVWLPDMGEIADLKD